ncbi:glutathione S-transferase, partial [Pavlovales sp. CCMP2436]
MTARVFDRLFSGGGAATLPTTFRALADASDAPSWDELKARLLKTPTGARLAVEDEARMRGGGPPHRASKLRLFGKQESDVRITFYRDSAAWCPYCQKVWLQLEEKQIPYAVELINMRSYGDKPAEFLRRVPSGLLPAIELDGKLMTDSMAIMC